MKAYDSHTLFGPLPRQAEFMERPPASSPRCPPWRGCAPCAAPARVAAGGLAPAGRGGLDERGGAEASGGLGLDIEVLGAIATAVGESPLPEPYLGAGVLPSLILPAFDAHPLAADLWQGVISGQAVLGLAWQENPGELLPTSVSTSVAREGDRIHLMGVKRWVAPVGATGWLVHARLGEMPTLVWLRPDDPGVRVEQELRVDGSMLCSLHLDTVLPESRMIAEGAEVDTVCQAALETARLLQCSELYGIARRVYTLTLDYLKTRVQFGRPIGANQALQHRMVDAYISVQVCGALLADSYRRAQAGPRELARQAALAKARIAERVIALCREAVQLHGAIGYTDEYDIGLYLKRALHTASWLGSPRTLLARHVALRPARDAVPDGPGAEGDDYNAMSDEAFRQRVRGFLRQHYPQALRHVPRRLRLAEAREWYLTLSRHGWLAPAWPREHGGMALSPAKLLIFFEEMEAGARPACPTRASSTWGRCSFSMARPNRRPIICRASSPVRISGARGTRSPMPVRTSPRCAPRRGARASISSSMVKKYGPRWRMTRATYSPWCARTTAASRRPASVFC